MNANKRQYENNLSAKNANNAIGFSVPAIASFLQKPVLNDPGQQSDEDSRIGGNDKNQFALLALFADKYFLPENTKTPDTRRRLFSTPVQGRHGVAVLFIALVLAFICVDWRTLIPSSPL